MGHLSPVSSWQTIVLLPTIQTSDTLTRLSSTDLDSETLQPIATSMTLKISMSAGVTITSLIKSLTCCYKLAQTSFAGSDGSTIIRRLCWKMVSGRVVEDIKWYWQSHLSEASPQASTFAQLFIERSPFGMTHLLSHQEEKWTRWLCGKRQSSVVDLSSVHKYFKIGSSLPCPLRPRTWDRVYNSWTKTKV